jgi:hypothetical protein
MQLLRNRRGDGPLEATPKLFATLIAAGIAYGLTSYLGRELEDAEKLINTTAPLIAGLLTGYWWDDNWD